MNKGTVKFYNDQKGFGFIQPDDGGKDVLLHATALERAGMRGPCRRPKSWSRLSKSFQNEFFGPNECCACHFERLPDYQNFLREASFPIIPTPNADGTGAAFFLFFSAFGFFFSRLLLNWPFAILSSLRLQ